VDAADLEYEIEGPDGVCEKCQGIAVRVGKVTFNPKFRPNKRANFGKDNVLYQETALELSMYAAINAGRLEVLLSVPMIT